MAGYRIKERICNTNTDSVQFKHLTIHKIRLASGVSLTPSHDHAMLGTVVVHFKTAPFVFVCLKSTCFAMYHKTMLMFVERENLLANKCVSASEI